MGKIEHKQVESFRAAMDDVCETLRRRTVNLDEKHYVFVPDRYTLFAEREIFRALGGAFDVEILTFNRLFSKFFRGRNYLPRHGAVMLLKRVIEENKKDFACFSRSAEFKGFAEKLYDAIKLLSACRISPQDLTSDGAIKTKIDDVRLIYSKYAERTRGKHVDAAGRGELLISEVSARDFTGVRLYFPMHGEFTRQERETVEIMCKTAFSCVKYDVPRAPEKFGKAEFYVSEDVTVQLKAAAKRMRYASKRGISYERMGVIAPASALSQAERIFKEFGIPFYIDKKIELGSQALPAFVERLYETVDSGYNAENFIALSKNVYFGADKSDSDAFENYCIKYRIDYLGFFEPFTRGEPAEREAPERVRSRLGFLVREFEKRLKEISSAQDFYMLICDLTSGAEVVETTARLSEVSGVDLSAVPEKMRAAAALLQEVWGDERVGAAELFETFSEGIAADGISPLPKERGSVEVGDAAAFIAQRFDCTFIIGLEEGSLPPLLSDCAVITDGDMDVLAASGVTLEPKISDLNRLSDECFLHSAASGENLFVGCKERPEKSAFPVLGTLFAGARNAVENSPADENERLKDRTRKDYAETVARHCCTVGNASELYLISRGIKAAGGKGLPFHDELKDALKESGAEFSESAPFDAFGITEPHDVFFYENSTTISRVQDYFACPYRNFLKNAVRLSEREDGRLQPMDVGNFLHRAVELFVVTGEFAAPDKAIENAIEKTLEENEKYVLDANKPFVESLCAEARKVLRIVGAQILGGSFTPLGQEMRFGFGENSDLKTVKVSAGGREISLRGIIDRVDVYKNYARVIDYKTGGSIRRNFDFTDLYYGRKIQLMLYMKILGENGYLPAGMFYFPFSASWNDDEFSHRLIGVYNGEEEIAAAIDNELKKGGTKSRIINAKRLADGERFAKSNFAFSTAGLEKLSQYALEVLKKAAEEIVSGETGRSPLKGECEYCAYKSVCRADENTVCEREPLKVDSETVLGAVNSKVCHFERSEARSVISSGAKRSREIF